MTETPGDRIRKLLLRADNTLKHAGGGDDAARVVRARRTLEEARDLARDPAVPEPVRELITRRLDGLAALDAAPDADAG